MTINFDKLTTFPPYEIRNVETDPIIKPSNFSSTSKIGLAFCDFASL